MKRCSLDSDERTISLTGTLAQELSRDFFNGKLNLTDHLNRISSLAKILGEKASKKYKGKELVEYTVRMNTCLRKLKELEECATLQSKGKKFDVYIAISSLAYVMADLTGLKYTINYKNEGALAV